MSDSDNYIKLCKDLISELESLIPIGHALYKEFDELRQDFKIIKVDSLYMVNLSRIHIKLCELKKKLIPIGQNTVEVFYIDSHKDCSNLEQQNANLLQIIDNLSHKLGETYERFTSDMHNLTDIQKNEVGKLNEEIKKLRKELKDLTENNSKDKLINKRLAEIIEGIKKVSNNLLDAVKEQKNEVKERKNEYDINIKKLTDELKNAREFIATLNAENKNLVEQLAELTEMNNKIINSNEELEKKRNDIENKVLENNIKINNLETELKEIKKRHNYDSDVDDSGYDSDIDESSNESDNITQQYNELLNENKTLIEENAELLKDKQKLEETQDNDDKEYNELLDEFDNNKKQLNINIKNVNFLKREINRLGDQTVKIIKLEKKIKSTQIISVIFKNIMFIYDELNYFDEFSRIKPNNMSDNYKSTPKELKQVDASKLSNHIVILYNTYAEYFTKIELSFIILFFKYIDKLLLRKNGIFNNRIFGKSVQIEIEYKKVISAFSSTILIIYKSIIHRNLYTNSTDDGSKEIIERIANFIYHLSNYLKISEQVTNDGNTSRDLVINNTLSHDKAHAKILDNKMIMSSLTNERRRFCTNPPPDLKNIYDKGLQTRPNTPSNFNSPITSVMSSHVDDLDNKHDDSPLGSSISSSDDEYIAFGLNKEGYTNRQPPESNTSFKIIDDDIGIFSESESNKFVYTDLVSKNSHIDLSSRQNIPFEKPKETKGARNDQTVYEHEPQYYRKLVNNKSDNENSTYFGGGVLGGCVMLLNNAVAVLMIMCVLLIMYIIYLYYTNYNNTQNNKPQNNKPQNNYNPYDIMY